MNIRFSFLSLLSAASLGIFSITTANAYTITMISPSVYDSNTAVMDANLGITGYTIENFEDTTLVSGVGYTLDGGITSVSYTTLPGVYTNGTLGNWDGPGMLLNTQVNTCPGFPAICNTTIADRLTFDIFSGTSVIGVGLTSFQSTSPASSSYPLTNHRLYINGVSLAGTLESLAGSNWAPSAFGRNGYLLVTQDPGDALITSLGFENITHGDILVFDHLAIASDVTGITTGVPVPSVIYLLAAGIFGLRRAVDRKVAALH